VINIEQALTSGHVPVEEEHPWSRWPESRTMPISLNELEVNLNETGGYAVSAGGRDLGYASHQSLRELGWHTQFPVDFIEKLTPNTAVTVMNDRIQSTPARQFTAYVHGDSFTNLVPGHREVLPYQETAQFFYDGLRDMLELDVTVDVAQCQESGMYCRFVTPIEEPVTPAVGDILNMGVEVRQCYGTSTQVALYTRRLVCLNGMTANASEFSWKFRANSSRQHQLEWAQDSLASAMVAYRRVVDRSRVMANTTFDGDYVSVLREHARAMRLPARFLPQLTEMFEQEPGNTEWHILNAFTRLATHGELPRNISRTLGASAGDWAANFEVVTARLPRPVANFVGAHILEGAEELERTGIVAPDA